MAHRDVVDARAAEQHIFIREISGRFVVEGEQPFLDGKPHRHAHHALGEREHHMRIAAGIRLPAPLRDDLPMAEHHRAVHMEGWAGIQLFKKVLEMGAWYALVFRDGTHQAARIGVGDIFVLLRHKRIRVDVLQVAAEQL